MNRSTRHRYESCQHIFQIHDRKCIIQDTFSGFLKTLNGKPVDLFPWVRYLGSVDQTTYTAELIIILLIPPQSFCFHVSQLITRHCFDGAKWHSDPLEVNKVIGMKTKKGTVNANVCTHTHWRLIRTKNCHPTAPKRFLWNPDGTMKITKPKMCCSRSKTVFSLKGFAVFLTHSVSQSQMFSFCILGFEMHSGRSGQR